MWQMGMADEDDVAADAEHTLLDAGHSADL
jgi:hypothetical protein